jgi:hypothetical protein
MSFNKSTWSQDQADKPGIKMLGAMDAVRKGYAPKYARKGIKMPAPVKATPVRQDQG